MAFKVVLFIYFNIFVNTIINISQDKTLLGLTNYFLDRFLKMDVCKGTSCSFSIPTLIKDLFIANKLSHQSLLPYIERLTNPKLSTFEDEQIYTYLNMVLSFETNIFFKQFKETIPTSIKKFSTKLNYNLESLSNSTFDKMLEERLASILYKTPKTMFDVSPIINICQNSPFYFLSILKINARWKSKFFPLLKKRKKKSGISVETSEFFAYDYFNFIKTPQYFLISLPLEDDLELILLKFSDEIKYNGLNLSHFLEFYDNSSKIPKRIKIVLPRISINSSIQCDTFFEKMIRESFSRENKRITEADEYFIGSLGVHLHHSILEINELGLGKLESTEEKIAKGALEDDVPIIIFKKPFICVVRYRTYPIIIASYKG